MFDCTEHAHQHPTCVWNVVNTHLNICDPDNRTQLHLSKEDQQSLEYVTDLPLATPDGEPPIHTFDVGNRVMVGDVVVAYGDTLVSCCHALDFQTHQSNL